MPESPRRSRFQIHLSTAVVLMFAAGGILWANLAERRVPQDPVMDRDINDFDRRAYETIILKNPDPDITWTDHYRVTSMGWPCRAVTFNDFSTLCLQRADLTIVERTRRFHFTGLLIDAGLALGVLMLLLFVCEFLIRRRTSRTSKDSWQEQSGTLH